MAVVTIREAIAKALEKSKTYRMIELCRTVADAYGFNEDGVRSAIYRFKKRGLLEIVEVRGQALVGLAKNHKEALVKKPKRKKLKRKPPKYKYADVIVKIRQYLEKYPGMRSGKLNEVICGKNDTSQAVFHCLALMKEAGEVRVENPKSKNNKWFLVEGSPAKTGTEYTKHYPLGSRQEKAVYCLHQNNKRGVTKVQLQKKLKLAPSEVDRVVQGLIQRKCVVIRGDRVHLIGDLSDALRGVPRKVTRKGSRKKRSEPFQLDMGRYAPTTRLKRPKEVRRVGNFRLVFIPGDDPMLAVERYFGEDSMGNESWVSTFRASVQNDKGILTSFKVAETVEGHKTIQAFVDYICADATEALRRG
jgi:hypothetical protein